MSDFIEEWKNREELDLEQMDRWFTEIKESSKEEKLSIRAKQKTIHTQVFDEIDCISCANCCKTAPPLLTSTDIKRIAKHLGISKKQFCNKYVLEDINGERSLNYVPCHFLQEDGACGIYEIRPEACRRYPHTDEDNFLNRKRLNMANAIVCPASFQIMKQLSNIDIS